MYPGFVLIMNGKTANMEMTVMKDEVYTHRILKAGGMPRHAGPYGEGPEMVRRQRVARREGMIQSLYQDFWKKEWVRQGVDVE